MPSLYRNEKATCEICGTPTKKLNLVRTVDLKEHDFVASAPTSLKKSHNNLKCHITTKNSAPKPDATFKREH